MSDELRHLSEEAFQGFLDGSLPDEEARRVGEHMASCARCRSELEAWEVLFHGLDGLGDLAPSAGFAERVMEALPREPEKLPLAARVGRWLGRTGTARSDRHLTPGRIQDFLEGLVPRPEAGVVEDHLHACRLCRDEVDAWRAIMVRLDEVPRLAPSPDFTERVMAHVRVRSALAVARPTLRERMANRLGTLSARTRRRIAGLAGAAVTPLATMALVAWVVFSHPLVTVGSLLSFLRLEAQDAFGVAITALLGESIESGLLSVAADVGGAVAAAPVAAALAFTMFGVLTVVAVWVLYRNLVVTTSADERYAPV